MVSGLEFIRMACSSVKPSAFKFDPFGDKEQHINSFDFKPFFDFLEHGDESRPASKPEVELKQPKPLRTVALVDARQRLEEMAWSAEYMHGISDGILDGISDGGSASDVCSKIPTASPHGPNPLALSPNEHSTLPVSQRIIRPPKHVTCQRQQPPSPGHACLSPGFLDHYSAYSASQVGWPCAPRPEKPPPPTFSLAKAHAHGNICFHPPPLPQPKPAPAQASGSTACLYMGSLDRFSSHIMQQGAWSRAPHPEGPPRPTFFLSKAPAQKDMPAPSSIPTIPLQSEGNSSNKEEENECKREHDSDESVEGDALTYITSFSDEEEEAEDMFEDGSEMLEESDEEHYTVSEYSGYDADDDSFADDEASVPPASPRTSPSPAFIPSPYSSAGSLAYTTSTSPANSFLSTNSGASHTQTALSAVDAKVENPPLQLRWTVGMPGDAVTFLIAAERALQRQSQVQRQCEE